MQNPNINYIRAIATIAVIFLHVSSDVLYEFKSVPIRVWWIGNIYDSLVRVSVPLFFMISGALLLSKDYLINDFIGNRVKKIIPPFIFWSIVYILYNNINYIRSESSAYNVIKFFVHKIFFGSEYHLWFIYTILGCYLFVPIIRKWIKYSSNNEILYFLFLWAITIIIAIHNFNEYFPQIPIFQFSGYMGFFILGYYLNTLKVNSKIISLSVYLVGTFITAVGTYYLSRKHGTFAATLYGYLTPNVIISSVGAYLFLINVEIGNIYIIKMLNLIGKYSFGIYFVHVLVLRLLAGNGMDWKSFNPIVSIPLITILCLIISLSVIILLNKSRYLKLISG